MRLGRLMPGGEVFRCWGKKKRRISWEEKELGRGNVKIIGNTPEREGRASGMKGRYERKKRKWRKRKRKENKDAKKEKSGEQLLGTNHNQILASGNCIVWREGVVVRCKRPSGNRYGRVGKAAGVMGVVKRVCVYLSLYRYHYYYCSSVIHLPCSSSLLLITLFIFITSSAFLASSLLSASTHCYFSS